ncbi:hypothetical protein FISHEDRAFT_67131 [Fistulina hepatica ATCC 64428]|uniref:BBC1/AIM3 cysteine proteinase-fold domain-containing protein n=1 Tax=Fistulina hepatica ATCC 64428 TaxID=1128425 RepID=A0A0D7A2C5_9AGAR|nr:hypothetical protein FISHEDRAFT_67131 [Fistulina hepatica ATCC 64428]
MVIWGRVGVQVCEVATSLYERSKKSLVGNGSYQSYVDATLREVPGVRPAPEEAYLIYWQTGGTVHRRATEIMPGDVTVLRDVRFKGHKGLQAYNQVVGQDGDVIGIISEYEVKKCKLRVFQANQHVGQQTVEVVSYRLDDLKNGDVKVYRVLSDNA